MTKLWNILVLRGQSRESTKRRRGGGRIVRNTSVLEPIAVRTSRVFQVELSVT